MAKRQLHDWLTSYLKFTENSESPVSFHLWGGVSAISAALQRRVYIKWGHTTLYPNHYIILVGPSGQSRKGEAINIARGLVETLKVPLLGEDNSMESVILDMKNSISTYQDKGNGKLTFQCAISAFIEELSVFCGEQNTRFLAYLTNWYDSRNSWKRSTKHQGTDEIMGVCFNLLAATAPDWIPYILPREAIGGGFTSRCLFIVERGKSKIISDPDAIKEPEQLKKSLIHDLEVIYTLSGEMRFDANTREIYKAWYIEQEENIRDGRPAISDQMFQGYMARRAMHLFKLMMVMSVSRGSDMTLIEKDFRRALSMLLLAERRMPQVFSGIGRARYAQETEMILQYIAAQGSVTKAQVMNQFYRQVDDFSFDAVMKVLSAMKVIRVIIKPGHTVYEYIKKEDGLKETTLQ